MPRSKLFLASNSRYARTRNSITFIVLALICLFIVWVVGTTNEESNNPKETEEATRSLERAPLDTDIEAATCSCDANTYNCTDFDTPQDAQACYDNCMTLVNSDIHLLDDDENGVVCETRWGNWNE
jgi:hypothetical protein